MKFFNIRIYQITFIWIIKFLCTFLISNSLNAQDDYATIHISRESSKKIAPKFTVFFNKQEAFKIEVGNRVIYKIRSDGQLNITVIQGNSYLNPKPGAVNTRTVSIEKGKSYYFQIAANNDKLTYYEDIEEGKKGFEDKKLLAPGDTITENIDNPLPNMSASTRILNIRQRAAAKRAEVEQKSQELKNQIDDYFADLKKNAQLSRNVQPNINIEIEDGEVRDGIPTYNLRAIYSYDINKSANAQMQMDLVHYPSGVYMLNRSPAAKAIVQAAKLTVEKYLYEYLEPGSEIDLKIIGSADGTPIRRDILYMGEFGSLTNIDYYIVDSYDPSKIKKTDLETLTFISLSISKNDGFNSNETLAFLRSYGIRNYFENQIDFLKKTQNTFTHFVKVEKSEDAQYRKVTIQIFIEDVIRAK